MDQNEVFSKLESDSRREIGEVPSSVKKELDGSIKLLNLVSHSLELYFIRLFDAFGVILSGANEKIRTDGTENDDDLANFVDDSNNPA